MKGKSIVLAAILLAGAALLFTACNKNSNGTGQYVFVTDENGITKLDKDGNPVTEEWKTSVVYATDENGETYTNANGEKVTVKQTVPVYTEVIERTRFVFDEEGNPVTEKDGSYATEKQTVKVTEIVTNKDGSNATQAVTDKDGINVTETVTNASGETETQVVTEVVTEVRTEVVTSIKEVNVNNQVTYNKTFPTDPVSKTTSIYENPDYTVKETDIPRATNKVTLPSTGKTAAVYNWLKGVGGSQEDKYRKVLKVNSGSFAALGLTYSFDGDFTLDHKGLYSVLSKFDANGNVIWHCPIGTSGMTRMHDFAILSDGSFIAVGEDLVMVEKKAAEEESKTEAATESQTKKKETVKTYRAVMVKISSDGNILWKKTYGNINTEYFTAVAAMPDGGYVAGGKFLTEATKDDLYVDFVNYKSNALTAKFDSEGNVEWTAVFGGSGNDWLSAVDTDDSGNVYAACTTNSKDGDAKGSNGSTDVFVVKYGSDGTRHWSTLLKGSKSEEVEDIYADDSGCVFSGRYASSDGVFTVNRGSYDAFMAHCTADGNIDWVRTYGGLQGDYFYSVVPTSFGYAAVGATYSDNRDFKTIGNQGSYDAFIMMIDRDGSVKNVKALAGTGVDGCYDICHLTGNTFIVVGETNKTDKAFADISPKAGDKNSTAFIGSYDIK